MYVCILALCCLSLLETMEVQIALTVSAKLTGWSGLFYLAIIPENCTVWQKSCNPGQAEAAACYTG